MQTTNYSKITLRLLFPLNIMGPQIDMWTFVQLKAVVLSFYKTLHDSKLANFKWEPGVVFDPEMPGISKRVTVLHAESYNDDEIVVVAIATEHASCMMIERMEDTHTDTLLKHCLDIQTVIMRHLLPISDAGRAVESGWTRNGAGLFTLESAGIMHPLEREFMPDDWTQ